MRTSGEPIPIAIWEIWSPLPNDKLIRIGEPIRIVTTIEPPIPDNAVDEVFDKVQESDRLFQIRNNKIIQELEAGVSLTVTEGEQSTSNFWQNTLQAEGFDIQTTTDILGIKTNLLVAGGAPIVLLGGLGLIRSLQVEQQSS